MMAPAPVIATAAAVMIFIFVAVRIVAAVVVDRHPVLVQVGPAYRLAGEILGPPQRGTHDGRQQGENGHDHQQFNQREGSSRSRHLACLLPPSGRTRTHHCRTGNRTASGAAPQADLPPNPTYFCDISASPQVAAGGPRCVQ